MADAKALARRDQETNQLAAGAAATGTALSRVEGGGTTTMAVRPPRNVESLSLVAAAEASKMGRNFFYTWTVKNKDGSLGEVCGITAKGAMVLARLWGNCTVASECESIGGEWVFKCVFSDHETGFSVTCISKASEPDEEGMGTHSRERLEAMEFQEAQSKARRGAILTALPYWLQEACHNEARFAHFKQCVESAEDLRTLDDIVIILDRDRDAGTSRAPKSKEPKGKFSKAQQTELRQLIEQARKVMTPFDIAPLVQKIEAAATLEELEAISKEITPAKDKIGKGKVAELSKLWKKRQVELSKEAPAPTKSESGKAAPAPATAPEAPKEEDMDPDAWEANR